MNKYFHIVTSIKDIDKVMQLFNNINEEDKEHKTSIVDIKEVIEFEKLTLYEKNNFLKNNHLNISISEKLEKLFLFGRADNTVGILKINNTKELFELKSLNSSLYQNMSANSIYLDDKTNTAIEFKNII